MTSYMTRFDEFAGRWNSGVKNLKKSRIMGWKHACLYDISTKAFSDRVRKAAALENISQEMNVAGWYITHQNAALGTKTRLTCFALIGCTLFKWVSCIADRRRQLSCVGEGVYSDATQLNSMSSWVELCRRSVYSDLPTQLNSTSSWVASL